MDYIDDFPVGSCQAFPSGDAGGLTKREYMATAIMAAISATDTETGTWIDLADTAVIAADALLRRLKKPDSATIDRLSRSEVVSSLVTQIVEDSDGLQVESPLEGDLDQASLEQGDDINH